MGDFLVGHQILTKQMYFVVENFCKNCIEEIIWNQEYIFDLIFYGTLVVHVECKTIIIHSLIKKIISSVLLSYVYSARSHK